MDKTVIVLIGAGVCCIVIGFALFVKLLTTKNEDSDEPNGKKKLLDEDYMENFQECFEDTESIEDTLDQLANIYTNNQYMYNLITNALDFIRDEQGDYETALDGINVDSDQAVTKMHNAAIKKALNLDTKPAIARKTPKKADLHDNKSKPETEEFEEDEENQEPRAIKPVKKKSQNPETIEAEEFEEKEPAAIEKRAKKDNSKKEKSPEKTMKEPIKSVKPAVKKPVAELDEFEEDEEPVVQKKQEKPVKPEAKKEQKKDVPKKRPEVSEEDNFDDYMEEPPRPVVKKETKKINKKPAAAKVEEEEDDDDDLDGFKIG